MDHFEEAIPLAESREGIVKICPPGCVHLTFQRVTLDFENPTQFREIAREVEAMIAKDTCESHFRMTFGEVTLELGWPAYQELLHLFQDAAASLAWSDGEAMFLEETLNHMFPGTKDGSDS